MNLDEWREQAAKAAYEVWRTRNDRVVWDALEPRAQSLWRDVVHAAINEGRFEFRHSAELAEQLTRDENVRLLKIGREWAETATGYREAAERNLADFRTVSAQLEVLREALALGEASDGHHTHNELYEYRLLYNALAALAFRAAGWEIVKSWRHSDGERCFGDPDWFVVHAETPAGQITNHYKRPYWRHFGGIEEVERAPEWDGHTPEVAAMRLEASIEWLRQRFDEMAKRPAPVGREDTAWLVREVGREHIRRCEIEQCDICSGVLGIEERVNLLDDTTRACTGCADPRCVACTGVFLPGGIPVPDND